MGWASDLAKRAVVAGGRAAAEAARDAARPKVMKTTKNLKNAEELPEVVGDLQTRASGGNHRKATKLYDEVGRVIDVIQGAVSSNQGRVKNWSEAVRLTARFGTHRFELDTKHSLLGTVLKVKSGDDSTRALAGIMLSQLIEMDTSPVTAVQMSKDGKQLLVILGGLEP